jgi:hypothetical protein
MRLADALIYLGMGTIFGIILIKSEVVSWFRIQEMFRFQAFHMYGIIGSAIAVAGASIALLRRFNATTIRGEPITISDKPMNRGTNQILGGIAFGHHACCCWAPECRRRGLDVWAPQTIFASLTRWLLRVPYCTR